MSRFRPSILCFALAFAALSACDKVNLLAPTGSKLTISVNRTAVPIGGTADVTAVVTEAAGTAPQDGTTVTFSSTFGTMTPQEAQTQGGVARSVFTATGSGEAVLNAFSGSAVGTEVKIKAGSFAASAVSVRTEPATIPQSGGTVTVVATVIDASGGVLPNTLINFSVDNGNLSASAATSDARGEARVTLTTNRTTKINAAAGTVKATEFTLTALPNPSIAIGSCSTTPQVGVAVNCTITPASAPVVALTNVTVNWGDGTPEQNLGPITAATVASHTYSRADNYTVVSTATDQNGQKGQASIALVVVRVLPTITITGSATGTVGVPVAFTVTPQANPPQPITNVTVEFGDGGSRNLGAINGPTSVTRVYQTEGGYTVTATVTDQSGQKGVSSTSVIISRGAAPTVTLAQTGGLNGTQGTFNLTGSVASGLTIRNITVRKANGNVLVYETQSFGSFFIDPVVAGDGLTAVISDSAGNTASSAIVVHP